MNSTELPDPDAAARLAQATRRLIDLVRRSKATRETMEDATAALEAVSARLAPHVSDGPFMQRGLVWEGPLERGTPPGDFAEFFPYSPLVGPRNPLAPPMTFRVEDGRVFGSVRFGAAYVGPPQNVHGGVIAAAFDELLGSTNVANGIGGMTGTLTVRYVQPTPVLAPIALEGWVDRQEGRKVFTRGEMRHEDVVTASAEGVFIQGSVEQLLSLVSPGIP